MFKRYLNGSLFTFDDQVHDASPGDNNTTNNDKNLFFIIGVSLGVIVFLVLIYLAYLYFVKKSIFNNYNDRSVLLEQSEHSQTSSPFDSSQHAGNEEDGNK